MPHRSPVARRRRAPRPHPRPSLVRRPIALAVGVMLVVTGAAVGQTASPQPALAAVVHEQGFDATVLGWRSWYGSYRIAGLGTVWCVDHGSSAPDVDHGYEAASLDERAHDTRRAMAWAVATHGPGADRIGAAALMLVLHDLTGAHYPGGRLDVDRLEATDLAGFAGHEAAVIERARAIKADAVHASHRAAAATLEARTTAVAGGAEGVLDVVVLDAQGDGVAGVPVRVSAVGADLESQQAVTEPDGVAHVRYRAASGTNRFDVTADVPADDVELFRPTAAPAQRVTRAAHRRLHATTAFDAVPAGRVSLRKHGDAGPTLALGGARFDLRPTVATGQASPIVASLVTGADGRSQVVEVPAGRYRVVEAEPPFGYAPGGPWEVDVPAGGDVVVEAANHARRGGVRLRKIDAATGGTVVGAVLAVRRDADGDGVFTDDDAPPVIVTSSDPPAVVSDLLPGTYQVVERQAPPGYRGATVPLRFTLPPGETVDVVVTNAPLSSVRFEKQPDGPHDPAAMTLAGAVLVVTVEGGAEVGRCTTDDDGRCALPEHALEGGVRYCWHERVAPLGWDRAAPGCFTAAGAGDVAVVMVRQPSRYGAVRATKADAATGAPVAGAVYDLVRRGDGPGPAPRPPADATGRAGGVWVGRATSTADGTLTWAPQLPGFEYCAVEVAAPEGYTVSPEPVCTGVELEPRGLLELALTDERAPIPPEITTQSLDTPPTSSSPPPDTSAPPAPPPVGPGVPAPAHAPVSRLPDPRLPGPRLPVTGGSSLALALVGAGLLVTGWSLVSATRSGHPSGRYGTRTTRPKA